MKDDRTALLEVRRIVQDAMRPDSGATVASLLSDISGPLTEAGLDPMADIDCAGLDAGEPVCAPVEDQSRH